MPTEIINSSMYYFRMRHWNFFNNWKGMVSTSLDTLFQMQIHEQVALAYLLFADLVRVYHVTHWHPRRYKAPCAKLYCDNKWPQILIYDKGYSSLTLPVHYQSPLGWLPHCLYSGTPAFFLWKAAAFQRGTVQCIHCCCLAKVFLGRDTLLLFTFHWPEEVTC